jgi:hypothetical protein
VVSSTAQTRRDFMATTSAAAPFGHHFTEEAATSS